MTYPLNDVLAYSVLAYDLIGDYSNYPCDAEKEYNLSNKVTIRSLMNLPHGSDDPRYNVEPNEDQRKIAKDMVDYYQKLIFKALANQLNSFETKVLAMVQSGEVSGKDIGLIASLPKSYYKAVQQEQIEERLASIASDSSFIGSLNEPVQLQIEVLRVNHIKKLGCDVVNAVDQNNNIIIFFTGNGDAFKDTKTKFNVAGRVKRHQTSKFHKGNETVLNYVKIK